MIIKEEIYANSGCFLKKLHSLEEINIDMIINKYHCTEYEIFQIIYVS